MLRYSVGVGGSQLAQPLRPAPATPLPHPCPMPETSMPVKRTVRPWASTILAPSVCSHPVMRLASRGAHAARLAGSDGWGSRGTALVATGARAGICSPAGATSGAGGDDQPVAEAQPASATTDAIA